MARSYKMTFTLDDATMRRINRTASRLGIPKSAVVRDAVTEFAARADRLSDAERRRLLDVFDDVLERIPVRPARTVDREIAAVRTARRTGGRRTRAARR